MHKVAVKKYWAHLQQGPFHNLLRDGNHISRDTMPSSANVIVPLKVEITKHELTPRLKRSNSKQLVESSEKR